MSAAERSALPAIAQLQAALAAGLPADPDAAPSWLDGAHSHALMLALFELASVGIQLIDVTRRMSVAVNPALVQITGYTQDELLQGDPRSRFPARFLPVREGWFKEVARTGRFGPSEVQYLHKDGHLIDLLFSGVQVRDGRNQQYLWLNVQDVTHYRSMERDLRAAASQDRLTGLANRATLLAALQALVDGARGPDPTPFAVMFLDFDRFKAVNDTLGHAAGDELLRAIAGRLAAAVAPVADRAPGLAARLGGDEFVLLMQGLGDEAHARLWADALLQSLAMPYRVQQQTVHSSASIGLVCWQAEDESAEALLSDADAAMYEAKRQGRGRVVLFDRAMRERVTRARQLEQALGQAVAAQQLSLDFQPIIALQTGRMVAAEALLRWAHPLLGSVPPAEFIPLAEASGQILELGSWVLGEACRQWAAWQRQQPGAAPARVSVNLSRVQLTQGPGLLDQVRRALADAAMPASALQLEITEREMMRDPQAARLLMLDLAVAGVQLAMDNFGTGTSSLTCLRDYPFHSIKIDRSLVTDLRKDARLLAVARATIQVIEQLGMHSVAEGVEHEAEAAILRSLGCRQAQGGLFGPPLPAAQLLAPRRRPA